MAGMVIQGVQIKACHTCKFYQEEKEGQEILALCKRYPPQIFVEPRVQGGIFSVKWECFTMADWPPVAPEDWCGEWRGGSHHEKIDEVEQIAAKALGEK